MKKIFFYVCIFVVFGCKKNEQHKQKDLNFSIVDTLQVSAPLDYNLMEVYWSFSDFNEKFLNQSNYPLTEIYQYNLNDDKWNNKLVFEKEGPQGIGVSTGFHFHTLDSLYLVSSYSHKMFLFFKNNLLNKYDIDPDYNLNLFTTRKGLSHKRFIYFPGTQFLNSESLDFTKEAHLLLKFDVDNGTFTKLLNYPQEYHDKVWKKELLNLSFFIKEDSIYSSFNKSHYIYSSDLKGKFSNKFPAKSKYIDDIASIKSGSVNSKKAKYNYYSNGFYTHLIDDKYNRRYYRFAYHLPNNSSIDDVKLSNMLLSIVVLDYNLSYLGEISLPPEVSGYFSFVTKKGLHVSIKPSFNNKNEKQIFYIISVK